MKFYSDSKYLLETFSQNSESNVIYHGVHFFRICDFLCNLLACLGNVVIILETMQLFK